MNWIMFDANALLTDLLTGHNKRSSNISILRQTLNIAFTQSCCNLFNDFYVIQLQQWQCDGKCQERP